ncbi:MAG: SMC-Scp complex subunit ScpB [Oscillospiraceae bacterium]|jgi:segregation and condensation protein B|nr:SMC-Scp complex subunit ScpB [Oscillospiraceae bacterium]
MKINEGISAVEAILFAHGEPIEAEKLCAAAGVEADMPEKLVQLLVDRYESTGSALTVLKLGNSYQLAVKAEFFDYVRAALESKKNTPLSPAAMEVLTIIAYNQPVTKGFVEHVRGIDSSSVVNSLVDKNLLEEAGRLDVPGKPIAYKTTSAFLRCFQLSSLDDLPALPDSDGQVSFDEILISNDKGKSVEVLDGGDVSDV